MHLGLSGQNFYVNGLYELFVSADHRANLRGHPMINLNLSRPYLFVLIRFAQPMLLFSRFSSFFPVPLSHSSDDNELVVCLVSCPFAANRIVLSCMLLRCRTKLRCLESLPFIRSRGIHFD